jgi:hypothetical protein
MSEHLKQRPSHEEWLYWAQVVIDRLTTCVHVYSKPPYPDVFIPDSERQKKNGHTLDLLKRIHTLTDESDTPTGSLAEVAHHDERVIAGLALLLRDTLSYLPTLSADMQKLLKSPWHDNYTSRTASELFRGTQSHDQEGIGSGHPEHGRLPEVLYELLEREQIGDQSRRPREALQRQSEPQRHDQVQRRWADKNSRFLRSAGRVE